MSKPNLDHYREVPDRIRDFKAKYPEGSLRRQEWHVEEVGDQTFIVYTALAYRTEEDTRPGIGTAWEPFPGKTQFTKDSELMNAETSAWGRAIVALGFLAQNEKVASKEEVHNRSNGSDEPTDASQNGAQRISGQLAGAIKRRFTKEGLTEQEIRLTLSSVEGVEIGEESDVEEVVEALTSDQATALKAALDA